MMSEYNLEYIQKLRIHELKDFARQVGIASPTTMKKEDLISKIKAVMSSGDSSKLSEKSSSSESLDFFSLLTSANSNLLNDLLVKSSKNVENTVPWNDETITNFASRINVRKSNGPAS